MIPWTWRIMTIRLTGCCAPDRSARIAPRSVLTWSACGLISAAPLRRACLGGLLVEKVEKVGRDARAAALGRHLAH